IVFDIEDADETSESLRQTLRGARWPDGRKLMTPLTGVCLMVFFVLACQCMSTLSVVARESGSWHWAAFLFAYMTSLAYVVTLAIQQGGRALGFGG
ncbi:MAG TPA: ferrous iron transport protein B, partial [Vicinamibacteria bacterium]